MEAWTWWTRTLLTWYKAIQVRGCGERFPPVMPLPHRANPVQLRPLPDANYSCDVNTSGTGPFTFDNHVSAMLHQQRSSKKNTQISHTHIHTHTHTKAAHHHKMVVSSRPPNELGPDSTNTKYEPGLVHTLYLPWRILHPPLKPPPSLHAASSAGSETLAPNTLFASETLVKTFVSSDLQTWLSSSASAHGMRYGRL